MPYKDEEKKKAFQRAWIAARRALFLQDKHCRECAKQGILTTEDLEIDHIDPNKKWKHRIWSYSWEKIMEEMKKCQILCSKHHFEKTMKDGSRDGRGHSK